MRASRSRGRAAALQALGRPPDPRFTLANERTFLAWTRTSLALIGGGLVAGQMLSFRSTALRLVVALAPIALGGVIAATSHARWERSERALRLGEPLPLTAPLMPLVGGVLVIAALFAASVVIDAAL